MHSLRLLSGKGGRFCHYLPHFISGYWSRGVSHPLPSGYATTVYNQSYNGIWCSKLVAWKLYYFRDPTWDINQYIIKLYKKLKTWRKVYWHIWGDAHFLYCLTCKRYFLSNQIGWCRFHPDTPQFFTLDAQKAPLPIGRYPCCGERAYRFQLLEDFSGCQFRQHMVSKDVNIKNDSSKAITISF